MCVCEVDENGEVTPTHDFIYLLKKNDFKKSLLYNLKIVPYASLLTYVS